MDKKHLDALNKAYQTELLSDEPTDGITRTISDIADKLVSERKHLFSVVQKVQDKEDKAFANNLKNFFITTGEAARHGNTNACNTNHVHQKNHKTIAKEQAGETRLKNLPDTKQGQIYNVQTGSSGLSIKLPKAAGTPIQNAKSTSIGYSQYNQLVSPLIVPTSRNNRTIDPIKPSSDQYKKFGKAIIGDRSASATDGAILITRHGTPLYGSQITQQAEQKNISANLATDPATSMGIPRQITNNGSINAANTPAKNEIQGTANTGARMATMLAILGASAAVAAVLWVVQGLVVLIAFISQVGFIATQITNITQLIGMAWSNLTEILGLEKESKEIGKFFEDNISKIFGGKSNYLTVKFTFMRIANVVSTSANSLFALQSASQIIADAVAEHSNNTSRMGNMWRAIGTFSNKVEHFNERVQLQVVGRFVGLNKLGKNLGVVGDVGQELVTVLDSVKTASETEKQIQEEEKRDREELDKTTKEQKQKLEGDKSKNAIKVGKDDI